MIEYKVTRTNPVPAKNLRTTSCLLILKLPSSLLICILKLLLILTVVSTGRIAKTNTSTRYNMSTPEAINQAIVALEDSGHPDAADKLRVLLEEEFEFLSLFDDE